MLSLVETVSMRLRYTGLCCRVISVSIKKADNLTLYSHKLKIQTSTDCTNAIYDYCKRLFDECWKGEAIRHLGVRVSELTTSDYIQLSMFEKNWERQKKLDKVVDQIRMKYGSESIITV